MAYLEVTIDNTLVDSDLTNFPVGIIIDSGDSILSGLGATDWKYLHATISDIECFVEVTYWNMSTPEAHIWVNVMDVSSSADTIIKIEFTAEENDFIIVSGDPLVWDDFTGNDNDPANPLLWDELETGTTFDIQSNQLQATHSAAQTVSRRSRAKLSGDFDIEIDFDIVTGPSTNVWAFQFLVTTSTATANDLALIDRRYNSGGQFLATIKYGGSSADTNTSTSVTSGKFRIVRSGTTATVYYDSGSGWTSLLSQGSFTTADLYILLRSVTTSSMTFEGAFDNLTINSCDSITGFVGETGDLAGQIVWDSNYVGVYHMNNDPSGGAGSILDSSFNGNDGTPGGSMVSGDLVDDGFGLALDFDGDNDSVNTGITTNYTTAQSFEIYTMPVSYANSYSFIFNKSSFYAVNVSDFPITLYQDGSGYINFTLSIGNDFNWDVVLTSTDVVDIDQWAVISGTADITATKLYIDGTLDQSGSGVTLSSNSRAYTFGQSAFPYAGGVGINEYNGRISEARISSIVRSAAWIKATAQNLLGNLTTQETLGIETPTYSVFGQISISGKNVNVIGVSLVEKGQWRTVEDIYMLIDKDWRLNIKS